LPIARDGVSQLVYYHFGVGTHWSLSDRWLGGGFGIGLTRNVIDLYMWLVYNYANQDELFLFGFSRGAYSVRSLAGLIRQIGFLPKDEAFYIPDAERLYRTRADAATIGAFRARHRTRTPDIALIGVWDTVGSLGIPIPLFNWLSLRHFEFHDVGLAASVRNARHALAIDERRKPFRPTLWTGPFEAHQTVKQRWFAGVHTNIGGGYDKDGLANVALRWMVNEAKALKLDVDSDFLAPYRPYAGDELRNSMTWKYRLFGSYARPICQLSPDTESVDRSVYARYRDDKTYRPKNLVDLIKRQNLDIEALAALPPKGTP
jgi:uncharacterized protein (DUF2235 family)